MQISAIIIHYFTPHLLLRCIKALLNDAKNSGIKLEILIVDNGSKKEDRESWKNLRVRVLMPGKNLGYAGGINLGVENATADIILLMNPDVEVFPGCLSALIDVLLDGGAVAGPRFFWDSNKRILLYPLVEKTRFAEVFRRMSIISESWAQHVRTKWRRQARQLWLSDKPIISYDLYGALLAVRRDAWQQVGPFDDEYQLYYEEADWLKRLKQYGLKSYYVPKAEAIHCLGQSSSSEASADSWMLESRSRFECHHYGLWFSVFLHRFLGPLVWMLGRNKPTALRFERQLHGLPSLDLSYLSTDVKWPIWIEISSNLLGFPAAATVVNRSECKLWQLPMEAWEYMEAGEYAIRVVDQQGEEITNYFFER